MSMTIVRAYPSVTVVDLHNHPPWREGSLPVGSGKVPSALRLTVPKTHKDHVTLGATSVK